MLSRSTAPLPLLAFVCILSCRSTEPNLELAAARSPEGMAASESPSPETSPAPLSEAETPSAAAPSCDQIPECPSGERKVHYQCVAYRYEGKLLWEDQRVYGWGPNLCEAKRAVALAACAASKDFAQLSELSCAPDPSLGSCPVAKSECPEEDSPQRCSAKTYQGEELAWDQRPTAWGRGSCHTKQLLLVKACEQGFNPMALDNIRCESDRQPGQCPPPPPTCTADDKDPTECLVSSLGDSPLKEPWKALGTSTCEAQYRLQQLLCRFTDGAKNLTPDSLAGMECRSLLGQTAQPKKAGS